MNTIYKLNIYTLGTFVLCCCVIVVFVAASIGGWMERRKLGRRSFIVNPSPDIVIDDDGIYLSPMTCEELERMLYEEHRHRKN
jgi:hypothetical protein